MPDFTPGPRRILIRVDRDHLPIDGISVLVRRGREVDMQVAEVAAKGDVLIDRDVLIAEEQDLAVEKRRVQIRDRLIRQILRQIDAGHFSADGRCDRADFERG